MDTKVTIGFREGTREGTLTFKETASGSGNVMLTVDGEDYRPADIPRGWRLYATPETDTRLAEQAVAAGYPIQGLAPESGGPPLRYLTRRILANPQGLRFLEIPGEYADALQFHKGDWVQLYTEGQELRIRKK